VEKRQIVLTREELIRSCEWFCFAIGLLLGFFTFVALFFVPGVMDLNRLIVSGLFASLSVNAFLLSAILSRGREQDGVQFLVSMIHTRPIVILGLFVGAFVSAIVTIHWWAKH
jgi:hypothetical protein